jgi:uncharacterized protein YPO0396
MFSPKDLSKLNETMTLAQIEELVREQERLQMREKSEQILKRRIKEAKIQVKKYKRGSKH